MFCFSRYFVYNMIKVGGSNNEWKQGFIPSLKDVTKMFFTFYPVGQGGAKKHKLVKFFK